jgi:hypothetical protein
MYTYITPFTSCSEVLQAAKNVSYESELVCCIDTLEAWRLNWSDIMELVRTALYSGEYIGHDKDDLARAHGVLNHAVDIKLPRIIEKRNL